MNASRMTATVAAVLLLTGCMDSSNAARRDDEELSGRILTALQDAHPVPEFDRSQERQNLVELTTARARSTDTTTFFFNLGIVQPVNQCPSVGFPIPATMQLTNPEQRAYSGTVLPQVEPTGVFTGDTTGTYVLCIDATGAGYAVYWEGFVQTITGPAEWDADSGTIRLVGPPSFDFTTDVADLDLDASAAADQ